MGAPAHIGTITPEGQFTARYLHWGNPVDLGPDLARLIARDGLPTVLRTLTVDHYGWSYLEPDTAPVVDVDDPTVDPRLTCARFATVPGYGIAYTTVEDQISPDEWTTGTLDLNTGLGTMDNTGYLYVFTDDGRLIVAQSADHTSTGITVTAVLNVDALVDVDWSVVECGPDFEHCSHRASHHDPAVPDHSSMSMAQWLGREPLTMWEATTATVNGVTYQMSGYTSHGRFGADHIGAYEYPKHLLVPPLAETTFLYSVADADGGRVAVAMCGRDGQLLPGVTLGFTTRQRVA